MLCGDGVAELRRMGRPETPGLEPVPPPRYTEPKPTFVLRRLDQHTPRNPDESATRCGQLRSPDRVAGAWLLRRLICAIVRTSYELAIACVANQ